VNNFEHHISRLEALGFTLERGMLIGDGRFAEASQIGTRFATASVQIDTYTREAFFEADKAHPVLGESQQVAGPEGGYTVTALLVR
jgi:hypothetical protein